MSSTLDGTSREIMLRNAYRFVARVRAKRNLPLWVMVSEITSHGSTYSRQICEELGWNPDAKIGKPLPAR